MPLEIVRNDITKMKVDAIVNAANRSLRGGGGVDGAIHSVAGPGLLAECITLGGCETGKAKITGGYNLPAKYVIHTVGPLFRNGMRGERELLESCYRESLALAKKYGCETVAFPLISAGVYGYPREMALNVASRVIGEFLLENDMTVYIVVFDRASFKVGSEMFSEITSYINDNYVDENFDFYSEALRLFESESTFDRKSQINSDIFCNKSESAPMFNEGNLGEKIRQMDESFSQMLMRKIDEKGMTDAECYKKANIDRKLFSKIRSDIHYKPSKPTVIAFAISLELSLLETEDMLRKAGFALSHSNKFDIIIEYFISKGNYNIFEINEALFVFDQSLLGV